MVRSFMDDVRRTEHIRNLSARLRADRGEENRPLAAAVLERRRSFQEQPSLKDRSVHQNQPTNRPRASSAAPGVYQFKTPLHRENDRGTVVSVNNHQSLNLHLNSEPRWTEPFASTAVEQTTQNTRADLPILDQPIALGSILPNTGEDSSSPGPSPNLANVEVSSVPAIKEQEDKPLTSMIVLEPEKSNTAILHRSDLLNNTEPPCGLETQQPIGNSYTFRQLASIPFGIFLGLVIFKYLLAFALLWNKCSLHHSLPKPWPNHLRVPETHRLSPDEPFTVQDISCAIHKNSHSLEIAKDLLSQYSRDFGTDHDKIQAEKLTAIVSHRSSTLHDLAEHFEDNHASNLVLQDILAGAVSTLTSSTDDYRACDATFSGYSCSVVGLARRAFQSAESIEPLTPAGLRFWFTNSTRAAPCLYSSTFARRQLKIIEPLAEAIESHIHIALKESSVISAALASEASLIEAIWNYFRSKDELQNRPLNPFGSRYKRYAHALWFQGQLEANRPPSLRKEINVLHTWERQIAQVGDRMAGWKRTLSEVDEAANYSHHAPPEDIYSLLSEIIPLVWQKTMIQTAVNVRNASCSSIDNRDT